MLCIGSYFVLNVVERIWPAGYQPPACKTQNWLYFCEQIYTSSSRFWVAKDLNDFKVSHK